VLRLGAQHLGRLRKQVERPPHAGDIGAGRFCHDQRAGLAFKEFQSKLRLKAAYLLGHRRLRHAKFLRRQTEIQMPRDDFKYTQAVERGKSFHELIR
jgi:hypothetical protein